MDKKFEPLKSGEVLSVSSAAKFLIGHSTFRISEFTSTLKQQMLEHGIGGITADKSGWLDEEGIECEVLRFGANGWEKGRVRLHIEFCPDQGGDGGAVPPAPVSLKAPQPAAIPTPVAPAPVVVEQDEEDDIDTVLALTDLEPEETSPPDLGLGGGFGLDLGLEEEEERVDLSLDDDLTSQDDEAIADVFGGGDLDFGLGGDEEDEDPFGGMGEGNGLDLGNGTGHEDMNGMDFDSLLDEEESGLGDDVWSDLVE